MSKTNGWEQHYVNVAKARADGFEVIFADDRTLLLDLDTEAQRDQYETMIKKFSLGREANRWSSKSGNLHVVVKLKEPASLEIRIAMQAVLGSDPERGLCHIQQVIKKANPVCLFKPKDEAR